jgi:hypothetical protein
MHNGLREKIATLDLESLTADVVALAMKAGASDAEAVVREGDEFSVNVRMGEVETLKESGSRGLGLRVFLGTRSASTSTSDLTPDGIRQLVDGAMALAKVTEEDPFAACRKPRIRLAFPATCTSTYDDVYSLDGKERIEWARRAKPPPWPPTRASPTPTAAASTPPPAAKSWPTRAALSAATAPATPASPPRRWPWTPTARCSATAGGPARAAGRSRIAGSHRQGSRAPHHSPPGRAQSAHAARAHRLRAGGRPLAHRLRL